MKRNGNRWERQDGWSFEETAFLIDSEIGVERSNRFNDLRVTYTEYIDLSWKVFYCDTFVTDHATKLRTVVAFGRGRWNSHSSVERYDGKHWMDLVSYQGSSFGAFSEAHNATEERFQPAARELYRVALDVLFMPESDEMRRSVRGEPSKGRRSSSKP